MAFVLDASAALAWCFQSEVTPFTEALLVRAVGGETMIVPAHWPTEVMSALLQGKRQKRITEVEVSGFLDSLISLRFSVEIGYSMVRLRELKALAERHGLSAYDAAYLDLAKRYGVPVATLDKRLREASLAEGLLLNA